MYYSQAKQNVARGHIGGSDQAVKSAIRFQMMRSDLSIHISRTPQCPSFPSPMPFHPSLLLRHPPPLWKGKSLESPTANFHLLHNRWLLYTSRRLCTLSCLRESAGGWQDQLLHEGILVVVLWSVSMGMRPSELVKRTVRPSGPARNAEAAQKLTPTGQSKRLRGCSSLAR